MVIFSKKRINILLFMLCISVVIGNIIVNGNIIKENSIETVAVPVTNRTVIVDAGHGLPDEGAINKEGISEEKINLAIAMKLQNLLESSGSTVLLTRSDENGIYDEDANSIGQKKISDIKNRVKIANESSADIFVSIHLNKIPQNKYYGWQAFYKDGDDNSKKLATSIQNNLNETISTENKRVPHKLTNVYLMKHVEIPISIIECGFLSNQEETSKLVTDEYQTKLAWGIYNGIMDYFAN